MQPFDINELIDGALAMSGGRDLAQKELEHARDLYLERKHMREEGYSQAEIRALLSDDKWRG